MKRKILLSLIPVASTSLLAATVISCDKKEDPNKKPGDDNLDPKPKPDPKPNPIPNESDEKTPFITKVETNEALDLIMKNKNNADFVLLDVRDPGEWEEGYIDNPVKISYNNRKTFATEINKLDKKKTYLIYCRTQNRSQKAAKEIKEMGFDYIYWMNGGYTQWAKEGKPITTPEKQKVVTELRVKNDTNIFKNINEAKIKLNLTNIGAGFINHVSDFTFKLFADDKELAKKELAKLENNFEKNIKDIFENITFENDKKYTIQIETLTNDKYHGYATYVFELSQTKTQKTYDDYANNKAFDHFSKSKTAELNDEFLTKNYQNGLFKYFLANNKAEKVQINQLANNGKKTLVLFASTTCLACLDALKLMDKVNTDNYNYVKVMTSISENDTKSSIADSEKVLDQENLGHLKENTYYDAYDFIWRDRIKFKTTPKFVLLDEYGQIINMFGVDSTTIDPFLTEVNKKLSASFSDELTKKNGEPISPIEPENPQDDQQQPDHSDNQIDDSNLTKYRTFEQRQKMKQLPSDAEKYSKHSYAKALKNMELQKSDGTMIKLSEIVKDKTKPTVVFLGSTHCQWCIKKLEEYKNKDLSSLDYNLVYGMESNGSNWEQFVKDNGAEKLKDTVLFRDSQKKLIQLVPDASGIPQCFILDEELNFTMFLSNSAQAGSWVNKIKGTISTLDENLTIPDDPNNTFDPYYGKYEEIKKQYPKDINRVPKRDIVAAEDELIIERKLNNFTDKEAEIKELRELFNQFIDDDKYHTYRVEKANYHARFMVDAMLEWFANDWVDHAYVQGGFYGTRFKTESISLNEDETEYDDQFIKLLSFSKYKNKNHPEFPKTIVNSLIWDQKYKNWFIQFIQDGLQVVKSDYTPQEKAFAISRYVADRLVYDENMSNFSIDKVLETGYENNSNQFKAVCQHYSWLGALLLNIVGVPAYPKVSNNGLHEFIWVKLQMKKEDKPHWRYLDILHIDAEQVEKPFTPNGYHFGQDMKRDWHNKFLRPIKSNIKYYGNATTYSGWLMEHNLPIDTLYKNQEMADDDYKNLLMISQPQNAYYKISIKQASNFFKVGQYWYVFTYFVDKNKPNSSTKVGLFRAKLQSNQFELVMEANKVHLSDDPVAKIFDKDIFLSSINNTSVVSYKNMHFIYKWDETSKHQFFVLSENNKTWTKTDIADKLKNIAVRINVMSIFENKLRIQNPHGGEDLVIDITQDETIKPLIENNTIETLTKKLWISRLEAGTYIYKDQPNEKYKAKTLRVEFDNLRKEIETKLKSKNLSQSEIESYSKKLDEVLNKIRK